MSSSREKVLLLKSVADPEYFSRGGGSNLKEEKTHYTHLNTSYLIVILWIDSV